MVEGHTIIDRLNREATERRCAELEARIATAKADAFEEAAESLETMMRNHNVARPMGKLRVDGWLQAAKALTGWARSERRLADRQKAKAMS
jgi:hypothetical protein